MLPSRGFFRDFECPFNEKFGCQRPYCHFRHPRKDSQYLLYEIEEENYDDNKNYVPERISNTTVAYHPADHLRVGSNNRNAVVENESVVSRTNNSHILVPVIPLKPSGISVRKKNSVQNDASHFTETSSSHDSGVPTIPSSNDDASSKHSEGSSDSVPKSVASEPSRVYDPQPIDDSTYKTYSRYSYEKGNDSGDEIMEYYTRLAGKGSILCDDLRSGDEDCIAELRDAQLKLSKHSSRKRKLSGTADFQNKKRRHLKGYSSLEADFVDVDELFQQSDSDASQGSVNHSYHVESYNFESDEDGELGSFSQRNSTLLEKKKNDVLEIKPDNLSSAVGSSLSNYQSGDTKTLPYVKEFGNLHPKASSKSIVSGTFNEKCQINRSNVIEQQAKKKIFSSHCSISKMENDINNLTDSVKESLHNDLNNTGIITDCYSHSKKMPNNSKSLSTCKNSSFEKSAKTKICNYKHGEVQDKLLKDVKKCSRDVQPHIKNVGNKLKDNSNVNVMKHKTPEHCMNDNICKIGQQDSQNQKRQKAQFGQKLDEEKPQGVHNLPSTNKIIKKDQNLHNFKRSLSNDEMCVLDNKQPHGVLIEGKKPDLTNKVGMSNVVKLECKNRVSKEDQKFCKRKGSSSSDENSISSNKRTRETQLDDKKLPSASKNSASSSLNLRSKQMTVKNDNTAIVRKRSASSSENLVLDNKQHQKHLKNEFCKIKNTKERNLVCDSVNNTDEDKYLSVNNTVKDKSFKPDLCESKLSCKIGTPCSLESQIKSSSTAGSVKRTPLYSPSTLKLIADLTTPPAETNEQKPTSIKHSCLKTDIVSKNHKDNAVKRERVPPLLKSLNIKKDVNIKNSQIVKGCSRRNSTDAFKSKSTCKDVVKDTKTIALGRPNPRQKRKLSSDSNPDNEGSTVNVSGSSQEMCRDSLESVTTDARKQAPQIAGPSGISLLSKAQKMYDDTQCSTYGKKRIAHVRCTKLNNSSSSSGQPASIQPAPQNVTNQKKSLTSSNTVIKPVITMSENVDMNIPLSVRQFAVNSLYEELIKFVDHDDAFEKSLMLEKEMSQNVNNPKTYKSRIALGILKIRKTKGELPDYKKNVKQVLTSASIPDYTFGISLYQCFAKHILSLEDLKQHGFPFPHPEKPGFAFTFPGSYYRKNIQQPSSDSRLCINCGKVYSVDDNGFPLSSNNCNYHPLRSKPNKYLGTKVYSCCGNELGSDGCYTSFYHVTEMKNEDMLSGFVSTLPYPTYKEIDEAGIFALDCEMVYTTEGRELARCSVTSLDDREVYDSYVKPYNPILDYCTRFSGVTEEILSNITTRLEDVQNALLSFISDKTILVGHSLENDLKVLKMLHFTVVDTSVVFPHRYGLPIKMSLKDIYSSLGQGVIQASESGHSSVEDSKACMTIMIAKITKEAKVRKPREVRSLS